MLNKVLLVGTVADLKINFDGDGKAQALFTLRYEESYGGDKTAKLFIPIDVFPGKAEHVADMIEDGVTVLIDGRLKWKAWVDKKSGEKQGRLAVLAWNVSALVPVLATSHA